MTDSQQNRDSGYLVDAVFNLAEMKENLTDAAKLVVLAALESDAALATALNGVYTGDIDRRRASPDAPVAEPAGAFLESIKARGFRGIGPQAQLTLQPAPGLTIVAGRNGSGKSSFSEALELALTGNTYRWSKRTAVWAEHWRNIHDSTPCEIRIKLAEEGVGATTVGVDWADDAKLPERRTWVQRQGKPHQLGVSSLGWDRAIELYRPILSYEELSGLLEAGPSTCSTNLTQSWASSRLPTPSSGLQMP